MRGLAGILGIAAIRVLWVRPECVVVMATRGQRVPRDLPPQSLVPQGLPPQSKAPRGVAAAIASYLRRIRPCPRSTS